MIMKNIKKKFYKSYLSLVINWFDHIKSYEVILSFLIFGKK